MQWEYKVVEWDRYEWAEDFNQLGMGGWELVAIHDNGDAHGTKAYFKRIASYKVVNKPIDIQLPELTLQSPISYLRIDGYTRAFLLKKGLDLDSTPIQFLLDAEKKFYLSPKGIENSSYHRLSDILIENGFLKYCKEPHWLIEFSQRDRYREENNN